MIQIVPANPEVIYVPQYNPTTVIVAGSPAWGYYPTPYPVYYYPYPPGAAFATGLIWGAAIGAAWGSTLGRHFPAMTLVQVSALIDPTAKVEIEELSIDDLEIGKLTVREGPTPPPRGGTSV